MPNEKSSMILKSKTDMTSLEIEELSEAQAWKIIYSLRTKKIKDNRIQICFTGFGISEKEELAKQAQLKKIKVVGSVTKNLDFLVGGENAGPKKVSKAEEQGVQFLSKTQFLKMIETGEIPEI